jgi:hypothetical protein
MGGGSTAVTIRNAGTTRSRGDLLCDSDEDLLAHSRDLRLHGRRVRRQRRLHGGTRGPAGPKRSSDGSHRDERFATPSAVSRHPAGRLHRPDDAQSEPGEADGGRRTTAASRVRLLLCHVSNHAVQWTARRIAFSCRGVDGPPRFDDLLRLWPEASRPGDHPLARLLHPHERPVVPAPAAGRPLLVQPGRMPRA